MMSKSARFLNFTALEFRANSYGLTIVQARTLLLRMKRAEAFRSHFIADDHELTHLPDLPSHPHQLFIPMRSIEDIFPETGLDISER